MFQAEDGIRDLVRSRGLGDVYKRQKAPPVGEILAARLKVLGERIRAHREQQKVSATTACLLYTSDAADERSSVDLGGRRIIKKKKTQRVGGMRSLKTKRRRSGMIRTEHDET